MLSWQGAVLFVGTVIVLINFVRLLVQIVKDHANGVVHVDHGLRFEQISDFTRAKSQLKLAVRYPRELGLSGLVLASKWFIKGLINSIWIKFDT